MCAIEGEGRYYVGEGVYAVGIWGLHAVGDLKKYHGHRLEQ